MLVAIVIGLASFCHNAPTGEVELSSNSELRQPKEEDLEQFFEDQAHLLPFKNNNTAPAQPSYNLGQIISQVMNPFEWSSLLSQLGLQRPDTTTVQAVVVGVPLDLLSQFTGFGRRND